MPSQRKSPAPPGAPRATDASSPSVPVVSERGLLEQLWTIFKRRRLAVIQALVVIPLAVLVITLLQDDRYTATSTLLFRDPAAGLIDGQPGGFVDPDRAAATNHELAALPAVAERAAEQLQVAPATVESRVTVEPEGTSDIARIQATAESPVAAAETANAYGEAYIDFRRESDRRQLADAIALVESNLAQLPEAELASAHGLQLSERLQQLRLAESLQTGSAELVQRASPPAEPSAPNLKANLILGVLLAAALAAALAALLERFDRRIRDVEELEQLYGLPILARIPRSKALSKHDLSAGPRELLGRPQETEAFRTLRANLRFFDVGGSLRSVLVASSLPGDGKSTVASWLAMTMAAMGDDVVLVESDLHKGGSRSGLSTVLAGEKLDLALTEVVLPFSERDGGTRRLTVLPSGPAPPNPSELLESDRMTSLLEELEATFDLVVIDSPALSAVSDALSLVPQVSGVLVVSGLGNTTRDAALELRKQFALVRGRPLGIVANFSAAERGGGYAYYSRPAAPVS